MNISLIKFTVEGKGPFPIDMLRYDRCWPATEGDAIEISTSLDVSDDEVTLNRSIKRQITLHRMVPYTFRPYPSKRWKNLGFQIISLTVLDEASHNKKEKVETQLKEQGRLAQTKPRKPRKSTRRTAK